MKGQLLQLIKELELLRAQARVDGTTEIEWLINDALTDLYYAYKSTTQYE